MIWKVSRRSGKFLDDLKSVQIIQNHLLCAFVMNLKIDAIYALYPENFCDKNLAIRKVFAFCDSELSTQPPIATNPHGSIIQRPSALLSYATKSREIIHDQRKCLPRSDLGSTRYCISSLRLLWPSCKVSICVRGRMW